jgi:hypothetical protein
MRSYEYSIFVRTLGKGLERELEEFCKRGWRVASAHRGGPVAPNPHVHTVTVRLKRLLRVGPSQSVEARSCVVS